MKWPLPSKVNLFEMGPRDGLQNEKTALSLQLKTSYIQKLIESGFKDIEVGAFVREDRVPQMASTDEIFHWLRTEGHLHRKKSPNFWALVPNEKGLDRALKAGCQSIAVFTGATESFTQKNIGQSVKESLKVFDRVIERAHREKLKVRGYLSVCFGCPYEGPVNPKQVLSLTKNLLDMGINQISLGDTIGVAVPTQVVNLLLKLKKPVAQDAIAVHFHDTRGTALSNCLAAIGFGVKTLDASSGGLGGCPYAPGASGNVATEDLIYMLHGMKIKTGINLDRLCEASALAFAALDRAPSSRYLQAWMGQRMPASSLS